MVKLAIYKFDNQNFLSYFYFSLKNKGLVLSLSLIANNAHKMLTYLVKDENHSYNDYFDSNTANVFNVYK